MERLHGNILNQNHVNIAEHEVDIMIERIRECNAINNMNNTYNKGNQNWNGYNNSKYLKNKQEQLKVDGQLRDGSDLGFDTYNKSGNLVYGV
jgi:hypothetical protein